MNMVFLCVLINHNLYSELSGSSAQLRFLVRQDQQGTQEGFYRRENGISRQHENDVFQRRRNVSFKDVGRSQDMMMQNLLVDPLHTQCNFLSDA